MRKSHWFNSRLMSTSIQLILLTFFSTKLALAGYDTVKITQIDDVLQSGEILAAVPAAPMVVIDSNGNGQLIFARYSATLSGQGISKIYAQSISASNDLQSPSLLVERTADYLSLVPLALLTADNGNAILHYSVKTEENSSIVQSWIIYYDAQSGWRQPIQIHEDTDKVQVFITPDGTGYAVVEVSIDTYNLYQYQANNTWSLVSESIENSNFGVGTDNRFYRIFDGNTPDTQSFKYISFFNSTGNQWQTPVALNQDAEGNSLRDPMHTLVSSGGDIFTLTFSVNQLSSPPVVEYAMRKYEASTSTWQLEPDVLQIPLSDNMTSSPFVWNFLFSNNTNDDTSFMGLTTASINNSDIWSTIQYNELTGWQTTRTILDLANESNDVELMPINFHWFGSSTTWFESFIATDNANHATVVLCRDNCTNFYAKVFNSSTGWSEELYLRGLANDTEQDCGVDQGSVSTFSPQIAVNPEGKLIAVSSITASSNFAYRYYHATATGDILSASSSSGCIDNTDGPIEPTNPPISINTDDASAGSLSLPLALLLLAILGIRFTSHLRKPTI